MAIPGHTSWFFVLKGTFLLLTLCSMNQSANFNRVQYYTLADFARVPKFDTHVHLGASNTAMAEQAKADNFRMITLNTETGIEGKSLQQQKAYAQEQQKKFPELVSYVSAITLKEFYTTGWTTNTIAQLKKDFENGALGIKIWKNVGMTYKDSTGRFIMVDDPRLDSVINFIISQDKTIVGHLGEPKNCWLPVDQMTVNNDKHYFTEHPQYHMYLHPEYPSYEDQVNARDNFLARHPDIRFVGAHLGSLEWSVDELAKRLDRFPGMAVDMAERICHLQYQSQHDREKVRQFIIKYQDRLLYGTDAYIDVNSDGNAVRQKLHATWMEDWEYFVTDHTMTVSTVNGEFTGLRLPRNVIDKIFHNNAIRWFKLKK